jgi:D-serine dehydratase
MANQLVGKQNMEIIAGLVEDPEFEFFCLVDSAEQAALLGKFFRTRKQKLNVLLELGVDGGRTGVRNRQQLQSVLAALTQFQEQLALCGIEIYEGILRDEPSIRAFLRLAVGVTTELAQAQRFERSPIILSGAGSSWYDVVAEEFSKADPGQPLDIILRPGCYLTHDVGSYREAQQRIQQHNSVAQQMESSLLPALQLWAYVQSIPEEKRAIIGLGKRDAAFDSGLPTPTLHYRPGDSAPKTVPPDWKLVHIMDQHAYLQMPQGADIRVGDMIGFDISHPCLTFDKWRYLLVVNTHYQVIDVVETFF